MLPFVHAFACYYLSFIMIMYICLWMRVTSSEPMLSQLKWFELARLNAFVDFGGRARLSILIKFFVENPLTRYCAQTRLFFTKWRKEKNYFVTICWCFCMLLFFFLMIMYICLWMRVTSPKLILANKNLF